MAENFSVAISYNGSLGYVEYDEAARKVNVVLGDEDGRKKAEDFLSKTHQILIPHETLLMQELSTSPSKGSSLLIAGSACFRVSIFRETKVNISLRLF